jgi:selenide,water dikinase
MFGMARLNKPAAKLMHKFNAHAATDVTGFGLLGHAKNLAANQKAEVSFVIERLPCYANMVAVAKASPINFKLLDGYSAETSGKCNEPLSPSLYHYYHHQNHHHQACTNHYSTVLGGLLIAMTQEDAVSFCEAFQKDDGHSAWIIGKVVKGSKDATIANHVNIIEV